jgi:hypothetical protein
MTDFSNKNDSQIDQWIANFETRKETGATLYYELLEERAKRAQKRHGLDLERSLSALKQAAIEGICITYGDLAKTSAVDWSKARHQMNGKHGHLDRLLEIRHARGLPLLTAICFNKGGLEAGELKGNALVGFAQGARRIGRPIADERAFDRACNDECWTWGKEQ